MVKINDIKIADLGFYINLDRRTDRKKKLTKQLDDFNITGVERYSAFEKSNSNVINCLHSHFNLYKKLIDSDHETMLILEDDCLFLDVLKENQEEIFENINKTEWDIFWLGVQNRKEPKYVKNKIYQVSSPNYAQSYIINKKTCKDIIENYPIDLNSSLGIPSTPDEFLCLYQYGREVVYNPKKFNFYQLEQPMDVLEVKIKSYCYETALTTQYSSYSDLWGIVTNYENYIANNFRNYGNE